MKDDNGYRPFTADDLFILEHHEVRAVITCSECGAGVVEMDRHIDWHNRVAGLV